MKQYLVLVVLLVSSSVCVAELCEQICTTVCVCDPLENSTLRVRCWDVVTEGESFFGCFNSSVVGIDILSSDITFLQASDFANLTNLKTFALHESPLENITQDVFSYTPSLEQITIQNTTLSYLFEATFANTPILTVLDLDDNRLDLSTLWLQNATSVGRLSLSNNDISSTPSGFFPDESGILDLNLSGNQITFISRDFLSPLSKLENLDLSRNIIDGLDSMSMTNLTELKILDLHDNVLTGLPSKLFSDCQMLQDLNISSNQMDSTQAIAFQDNDLLWVLDASDNLIDQISSSAFNATRGITHLYLQDNRIGLLQDGAFNYLVDLETLDLSQNPPLIELNPAVLPANQLLQLFELHVENCGLTSLDIETFELLPSLKSVYAHGNPIFCDCNVRWISENGEVPPVWMQPWVDGETALLCETPDNFNGSIVAKVEAELLTCEEPVINNNDEYSETNGNVYYYVVMLSNGLPSTNFTLPNGKVLAHGDTYDPATGSDVVTVEEIRASNSSIRSTLQISKTTKASEGKYLFRASNAGGAISFTFDLTVDNEVKTDRGKIIGGIIGGILGVILVIVIFGVVVDLVKNKRNQQPYNRMQSPTEAPVSTVSSGGLPDTSRAASRDVERSLFSENKGAAPYGGVDDMAQKQTDDASVQVIT